MRVDRGGHHAHLALHRHALGRTHLGDGAYLDALQLGGGDLGAPLQPPLAHHAEQFGAAAQHRAHGGAAGADGAAVGGQHLGVAQALLLHHQRGFGCGYPGLGDLLGGLVLVDLLLAQGPGGLQRAGAGGVGAGILGVGLGLQHIRFCLGHVGLHALRCKGGQHLPGAHYIAHVGAHFQQAQAAGLAADAGLLPGGHIAVGAELHRPGAALRLHGGDGERGLGRHGLALVRCLGIYREKADSADG